MNLTHIPEPRKRRKRGASAPAAEGRAAIYVRRSSADIGVYCTFLESCSNGARPMLSEFGGSTPLCLSFVCA